MGCRAPVYRQQLRLLPDVCNYSRNSINYSYWNFVEGSKHKPVAFIKVFYFYELLVVFKKHIRADSNCT
jgi:hypothetical protein